MGLLIAGEQNQTAGIAVDPVYDVELLVPLGGKDLDERLAVRSARGTAAMPSGLSTAIRLSSS